MTKEVERDCALFANELAKHCIASYDNNKSFYDACKDLNKRDSNLLLKEVIFFRCSLVFKKIFSEVTDIEKRDCASDYFFDFLSHGLQLDTNFLFDKVKKYADVELDKFTANLVLSKSGIDLNKISTSTKFNFQFEFFLVHLIDFSQGVNNMFEVFLADAEKRKQLEKMYKSMNHSNSGCLSSIMILIFVISFIVYII